MTPTIELLRSHRSIRHFTDAPVSGRTARGDYRQRASGIYLEFFYSAPPSSVLLTRPCVNVWSR
ncbi:Oxygen-insensitive NADPH nitroreductase [Klebsiella pneumoniae IS10]|nr:Oxygen-insensitive NADPH nitroreductase [Klebsiella pneumoniae IS10]